MGISDLNIWELFQFKQLELEVLPDSIRTTLKGYETHMERLRKRDLSEFHLTNEPEARPLPISQFGFVDEWRLNAYVDGKDQESLVVFTAALPFALRDQFDYLLYDARVLRDQPFPDPTLGLANNTSPPPKNYAFLRTHKRSTLLRRILGGMRLPIDLTTTQGATGGKAQDPTALAYQFPTEALLGDARRREQRVGIARLPVFRSEQADWQVGTRHSLAHSLTNTAFKFLLDHEIAHVVNGHLGYRLRYLRDARFAEMASQLSDVNNSSILQAMELDADTFAAIQAFSLVAPSTNPHASYMQQFVPLHQRVHRTAFAIGVLLILLEKKRRPLAQASVATHPPHRIRYMNMATVAQAIAHGWPEEARRELQQGLEAATADLRLVGLIVKSNVLMLDDLDVGAGQYLMRVRNTVKNNAQEWAKCAPDVKEAADTFLWRRLTRDLSKTASGRKRADLLNQRGVLSESRKEHAAAIADFRMAAETNELDEADAMRIRCNLARVLLANGDRDQGLMELDKIIQSRATEARSRALTMRADLRAREGNRSDALLDWERALSPFGNVSYPQELARVHLVRGQFYAWWRETDAAVEDFVAVVDTQGVDATHFLDACSLLPVT